MQSLGICTKGTSLSLKLTYKLEHLENNARKLFLLASKVFTRKKEYLSKDWDLPK